MPSVCRNWCGLFKTAWIPCQHKQSLTNKGWKTCTALTCKWTVQVGHATSRICGPDPSDTEALLDHDWERSWEPADAPYGFVVLSVLDFTLPESAPQFEHLLLLPTTRDIEPQLVQLSTDVCPELPLPELEVERTDFLLAWFRSSSSCSQTPHNSEDILTKASYVLRRIPPNKAQGRKSYNSDLLRLILGATEDSLQVLTWTRNLSFK
jgi:hypothetical protein